MRKSGFTLIELSIAILIIALLAAAIFAGRYMIENAKIFKTASQIGAIEGAIYGFETRYNGLPGDLANATKYFSGSFSGNGDGIIENNDLNDCLEPLNAWKQLDESNFISGRYTKFIEESAPYTKTFSQEVKPQGAFDEHYQFMDLFHGNGHFGVKNKNAIEIGLNTPAYPPYSSGWSIHCRATRAVFTPLQARNIDLKFDDGIANKGKLMGLDANPSDGKPAVLGDCSDVWTSPTGRDYNLLSTRKYCRLFLLLDTKRQ